MKCQSCNIKLKEIYKQMYKCKCENYYCSDHRTTHECIHEYKIKNNTEIIQTKLKFKI
jgi:hypothetical protein